VAVFEEEAEKLKLLPRTVRADDAPALDDAVAVAAAAALLPSLRLISPRANANAEGALVWEWLRLDALLPPINERAVTPPTTPRPDSAPAVAATAEVVEGLITLIRPEGAMEALPEL
jgi:hypothetical protein